MTNMMIGYTQYFQGGIVSHISSGICGYLGWVWTFLIRLSGNSLGFAADFQNIKGSYRSSSIFRHN